MEKTQKFAAYFTEDQKDKIDRCQDLDGSPSAAEVVRKAVDFYHGYLTAGEAGSFLPQAIQSYLDGRRGTFEDRISKLLFKLAVARRRSADTCATSAPASMCRSSPMIIHPPESRSSSLQSSQQIFPV